MARRGRPSRARAVSPSAPQPEQETTPPPPAPEQPPVAPPPAPSVNATEARFALLERNLELLTALVAQQYGGQIPTAIPSQANPQPAPAPVPEPVQPPPVVPAPAENPVPPQPAPRIVPKVGNRNMELLKQFQRTNPPVYRGVRDPAKADEWIQQIEKSFRFMGCSGPEKVILATFMLQGDAESWWKTTETILRTQSEEIAWESFQQCFQQQYVPETA